MRLINTSSLELEDFSGQSIPKYAVLSHRWQEPSQELSYHDFLACRKHDTSGWAKIEECCRIALYEDLQYCWIDTCCINKESSSEESRSINSMFVWYAKSTRGFVYLYDVHCETLSTAEDKAEFAASRWFTRGWTLQELIAPPKLTFYNSQWEVLGDKSDLCELLTKITNIPIDVLRSERSHLTCSVAQRMYWAAGRTTTVVEDQAYSLMGLFDVNMPLIYGEGDKAFMRLQEEIIQRSTDQTIFAWSDDTIEKGVLAPSPACFNTEFSSGLREVADYFPDDPASDSFSLGNAGLLIAFVLIPWDMNTFLAPLRCYSSGNQSGSDPGLRLCLILRRTKVDNRFIRIRYGDQDLVLHRYLRVPVEPNPSYWDRSRLHKQIVIARFPLMKIADCFYGFHFNFWCPTMFGTGSKPDSKDVVCQHAWNRNMFRLQVIHGTFRVAGIFRLNRKRFGASFLVAGFDADFNPFCIIATAPFELMRKVLPLLNVKREIIDPQDIGSMSVWERSSWLDSMYLHKYIDEIVHLSKESPFDWQTHCVSNGLLLGNRNTTEEVFELHAFKLMVIFKLVKSHPENHWRITFKDLPKMGSMYHLLDT